MWNSGPSTSSSLDQSIQDALFEQLEKTSAKCEKLSSYVENQERHIGMAEVPRVTDNRNKAKFAYADSFDRISEINSVDSMCNYFLHLKDKQGLFFQILRGKINKRVIDKLELSDQTKKEMRFTY
jgi:nanoRNase/pAp phosphatase (c-di-AMP/oligoRNAs hydrolase)